MANWGSGGIALLFFLILALHGDEWSAHCPSHFIPPVRNPCHPLNTQLTGQSSHPGEEVKNLFGARIQP